MSKKPSRDKDTKTFSLSSGMMGDLLFILKPYKEKQMEIAFWANQLKVVERDILKSEGLDPDKWSADWQTAFATGKLVCTKIPEPKVVSKEEEVNGKDKTNSK